MSWINVHTISKIFSNIVTSYELVSIHLKMILPLANIKLTEHNDRHIHKTLSIMKNHNMCNSRLGFVVGIPCGEYEDSRNTCTGENNT